MMKPYSSIIAPTVFLFAMMQLNAGDTKVFPSYQITGRAEDNNWYLVVGVNENTPMVLTNSGVEKAKIKRTNTSKTVAVNDLWVDMLSMEQEDDPKAMIIKAKLQSRIPIDNAYAVLTYINHGEDGKSSQASKIAGLPALTGNPQDIRLRFQNVSAREGEWDLHIYHMGMELYDRNRADLREATPSEAFPLNFRRHLMATGLEDSRPVPFYMPVKSPGPELLPQTDGPVVVKVKVTIGKNGRILSHSFPGEISPEMKKHLSSSIDTWLFFPEINKGAVKERAVIVPLKLR